MRDGLDSYLISMRATLARHCAEHHVAMSPMLQANADSA